MIAFRRALTALLAASAWAGLVIQLWIDLGRVGPHAAAIRRMLSRDFSYFTIVGNLLVAIAATMLLLAPRTSVGRFFARPSVRGAVALYLFVIGLVWIVVLAPRVRITGDYRWSNAFFHYIVPALTVIHWLVDAEHRRLRWTDPVRWLGLPFAYLIWIVARGSWSGEYPYPFVDLRELSALLFARNVAALGATFVILGLALVAIDRALPPRTA